MKMIIDIPDKYKDNYKTVYNGSKKADEILNAIKNGTVLPERHGRLVDADKLGLTDFEIIMCDGDYKEGLKMLCEKIENAPTILDAEMGIEKELYYAKNIYNN